MESLDAIQVAMSGLALVAALSYIWSSRKDDNAIPMLGPLPHLFPSLHFFFHGREILLHQQREGIFRVPILFRGWFYVTREKRRVQEIASAPESVLSFNLAIGEQAQMQYTLGKNITLNPYHALVVQGALTRNLGRRFPEVRDEIVHAFDEILKLKANEWELVLVQPAILQIVARVSNRLFVGLPLCRNSDYLRLVMDFAVTAVVRGQLLNIFPAFLRPLFGPLLSTRKSAVRRVLKFLGPIIDERLEKDTQYGNEWPGRPNDLISWLLDIAEGEERTAPALAMRVLTTNFVALHTSTMGLTAALYDLATYPSYIEPMREEVESVITEEGWTKAALGRMHKVDSFMRESQRYSGGLGAIALARKVVAPDGFKFSDGTWVPHGATIAVSSDPVHRDSEIYSEPDVFDGFRFSRMRIDTAVAGNKTDSTGAVVFNRQMVSTSPDHLVFGHGRHACPGRFFAATELKAMLAHILIEYDIKAEVEGMRPPDKIIGIASIPNPVGKIWVRKRV